MSSQAILETGYEVVEPSSRGASAPWHPGGVTSQWYASHDSRAQKHSTSRVIKRALDMALSTGALIMISPLMVLIAFAIWRDSPGSIFYRTYRVGRQGRLFRFYKFRTMISNADLLLDDVWNLNERQGVLFKASRDPRLTKVGRLLRRYSLDELPQFWNIIKGDMSLVGPRPPLLSEYEQFRPEHRRRMAISPGLTGLWQVTARRDPSFETYVNLDCHYVDHWNLWLDLRILLKTIPAVVSGTGN